MNAGPSIGTGVTRLRGAVDATALPTFSKICFVGASITNYTFQDVGDLTTRCTDVEAVFAAEGYSGVEIYCNATPGATLSGIETLLTAAMAQHTSDTLFVVHAGGNNVSSGRPYPGGESTIQGGIDDIITQANTRPGSVIFCDLTFRDYDDTTADDEDAGSKPYNDNIYLPTFQADRAKLVNHAYYDDGTPVACYYEWTYHNRLRYLSGDNVHPDSIDGERLLRRWAAQRFGPIATGAGVPAQVDRAELAYRDSLTSAIDPEAGLTLTDSFAAETALTGSEITVSQNVVLAMDFTGLDGTGGGIIFEMGASGNGAYIGFLSSGDFVARAGSGGTPPAANVALVQVNDGGAPSGDGTLVVAFDGVGSAVRARAWWNGLLLWEDTSTHAGSWAGADAGGFLNGAGTGYGGAMSGAYYTTDASYDTVSALRYYTNQTIAG